MESTLPKYGNGSEQYRYLSIFATNVIDYVVYVK